MIVCMTVCMILQRGHSNLLCLHGIHSLGLGNLYDFSPIVFLSYLGPSCHCGTLHCGQRSYPKWNSCFVVYPDIWDKWKRLWKSSCCPTCRRQYLTCIQQSPQFCLKGNSDSHTTTLNIVPLPFGCKLNRVGEYICILVLWYYVL